ncbi:hypothetical protein ASPCADRAFT_508720 [Aspergillus carbonarius ITEM 5010]|uniref:DUF4396 domain-containing protein n=1 Tax=Aspergillus carbonarius (strain ITEM 5010) TaxID=602072 RepID=A0A1R3RGK3_ASPC5|nr:hypothetical protein ASPCADRAFT_508720 [Aspergillus carbonarius ITEM 5010]
MAYALRFLRQPSVLHCHGLSLPFRPRIPACIPAHSNAFTTSTSHQACPSHSKPAPSLLQSTFWTTPSVWKRASLNTLRCLVGCTLGDFSMLWFLQAYYPALGMGAIMGTSMAAGIASSILLETTLLRLGRDQLPWRAAFRTATGMSLISMLAMECAESAVDYHLTGGCVALDDPQFWAAAVVSVGAGFLAALPYNYIRLRKYGRACH